MARRGKLPTIQDVAARAKVSTATVSRALSAPDRVSPEMRQRVSAAIRSTGYAINQAARSLRSRAAHTIVVAIPNVGNPYYSVVLDGLLAETASRGFGTLLANRLGNNPSKWLADYFLSSRADGMVLFDGGLDLRQFFGRGGKLRFPLVVACDEMVDPRVGNVGIDNRAAATAAVRHLIELGHRRIGHVSAPSRVPHTASDRLLGYRDALTAAGLDIRDDWVLTGDFSMPSGETAAHRFLALRDRPTAMFIGNDEMAIGFIKVCRDAGVECPRNLSVIGFDDLAVSRCIIPALTTIRQPRFEIGRTAAQALLDMIQDPARAPQPREMLLPFELVTRDSTAPPARIRRGNAVSDGKRLAGVS